jgi:hypothetical protein
MDTWSIRKNEPKTNPNEPKTNPILANKTPEQTQFKPKRTQSPKTLNFRLDIQYCGFKHKNVDLLMNYAFTPTAVGQYNRRKEK